MDKLDDKVVAMSHLRQAAKRNKRKEALALMMATTPRGAAVNWAVVRARLDDFLAKRTPPTDGGAGIAPSFAGRGDGDITDCGVALGR